MNSHQVVLPSTIVPSDFTCLLCVSAFCSRCFAALGDVSTVRFLHQTNQIADKVSREMVCFRSAQTSSHGLNCVQQKRTHDIG